MGSNLFQEGGPLNLRRTGSDQYTASITLPPDADGFLGRECVDDGCAPGYFKVKPQTGLANQATAYCPYCRKVGAPGDFTTKEQTRYAKQIIGRHAVEAANKAFAKAMGVRVGQRKRLTSGLINIDLMVKPARPPVVFRPREDELRRDLVCSSCGLHHAVFGLAIWCPDCGRDIFMEHIAAELSVIDAGLQDVPRRRDLLGRRAAAKDIENALEDVVSVFEAALKALTHRKLVAGGLSVTDAWATVQKDVGNAYQNVGRAQKVFFEVTGTALIGAVPTDEVLELQRAFEKRHPIAHNLGVIDKKYLARVQASGRPGRELKVMASEILRAMAIVHAVVMDVHIRLFPRNMKSAAVFATEAPDGDSSGPTEV